MKRDQGKVETFSIPDFSSAPAGTGGPSMPESVVQPLTDAALSTNPIAASLDRIGTMLDSLASDWRSDLLLSCFLEEVENRRNLLRDDESLVLREKIGREEDEDETIVAEEARVSMASVTAKETRRVERRRDDDDFVEKGSLGI